jgi:hypothetical protein
LGELSAELHRKLRVSRPLVVPAPFAEVLDGPSQTGTIQGFTCPPPHLEPQPNNPRSGYFVCQAPTRIVIESTRLLARSCLVTMTAVPSLTLRDPSTCSLVAPRSTGWERISGRFRYQKKRARPRGSGRASKRLQRLPPSRRFLPQRRPKSVGVDSELLTLKVQGFQGNVCRKTERSFVGNCLRRVLTKGGLRLHAAYRRFDL